MQRYTFSMTPFKQGSSQYGDIDLEGNKVDLLSAATASAAFFDANQTVVAQPLRSVAGAGQHLLNLSWGIDIPHSAASDTRRTIRSMLPFPFYYADYWAFKEPAYVRLLDGGSSDNLGAYRLIVDGFNDVVISDHAQDVDGRMWDLCMLRNELEVRDGLYLHMSGLDGWPDVCASMAKRSMEDNGQEIQWSNGWSEDEQKVEYRYPIHAWPYPFLTGCVSGSDNADTCLKDNKSQRIWLIKPAMDFAYYHNEQVDRESGLVKACDNQEAFFLPCETSGFLIHNFGAENKYGFPRFPQNGTVAMTIDSSSTLYGAYRDLAEFYTVITMQARQRAERDPSYFQKLFKAQQEHKIKYAKEKETVFNRNWNSSDITHDDWQLDDRNAARKAFGEKLFTE